jgi:hypothetical protein
MASEEPLGALLDAHPAASKNKVTPRYRDMR